MSRRVRHTNVTAEEAQSAGSRAGPVESSASSWNTSFHNFSSEERARILALAQPAGFVYAQQLPEARPAKKSDEPARTVFAPFLNGQAGHLKPIEAARVDHFDAALDRWQQEAVAKALATNDVFLLRGQPGSGKSRVLVEFVRQSAARGQRILFLSRRSSALDRVLTALADGGEGLAARCAQPGENESQLEPKVRASLLETRIAMITRRACQAGTAELANCQQALVEIQQALALYPKLAEHLNRKARLETQRRDLDSRQAIFRQEIACLANFNHSAKPTGELGNLLEAWSTEVDSKKASALAVVNQCRQAVADCDSGLALLQARDSALRPIWQARMSGRFWTPAWWKSLFSSDQVRQAIEVDRLLSVAKSKLKDAQNSLDLELAQQLRVDNEAMRGREQLLSDATARREAAFTVERGALEAQLAELSAQWQTLVEQAPGLAKQPISDPGDLERARTSWTEELESARAGVLRAGQWLALLENHPHALRDAFLENVPLLAATAAGWQAARGMADRFSSRPFDTLILEEAEEFSESECAAFARLAGRWLLVGSDYLLDSHLSVTSREAAQKQALLPQQPPVLLGQLWQRLHSNPERLPYAWLEEGDKLICRLRMVQPDQRRWMEVEHLDDHPQIVLHILALPRSRPVIAEVEFPTAFTIQTAKQFILDELQELAVCSAGRSMRWHDDPSQRLVLQLAAHDCHHPTEVALAPGIRENLKPQEALQEGRLSSVAWNTCCIEFDRESGWQRGTAEEWVERHLGLRDIGRTIFLESTHRFTPALAAFVKSVLAALNSETLTPSASGSLPADQTVAFVAVPQLQDSLRAERTGLSRVRSAGLELDLSEPRSRERLPADLRSELPAQGIVNLSEAQAIVRRLVESDRAGTLPPHSGSQPSVFIIALYESQAALIWRLIRATPALAARSSSIEVGVPGSFAHREAAWAIVSLTRSHTHRATGFGAGPRDIVVALSRAREKLMIFGDAGALARRTNWEGTVERLDPHEADQERKLIRTLLAGFQRLDGQTATVGSEGSAP